MRRVTAKLAIGPVRGPHRASAMGLPRLRAGPVGLTRPTFGFPHPSPAAVARFHRGVRMTKLNFLLQCSTTLLALHNDPATAISTRPERGGPNREGLDIMRKSLPIALVLARLSRLPALRLRWPQPIHNQVTHRTVAGAPRRAHCLTAKAWVRIATLRNRCCSTLANNKTRPPFPAIRGTICYPLPY